MSWVDGQVVTDWAAEIAKREQAIAGYLDDADPGRAEKYGFRSGQNPRLAWAWFRNNPVGFNGVPFVLLQDHPRPRPESRRTRRCAPSRASGSARRSCRPAAGSRALAMDARPHRHRARPADYVDGVARPAASASRRCPTGSPSRTRARSSRCRRPKRRRTTRGCWPGASSRTRRLLVAKLRTTDKEENWERDRPGFGSPGSMDRVFLSCAACHVGRVDGRQGR